MTLIASRISRCSTAVLELISMLNMKRTINELLLKHNRHELLFSVANCQDAIVNCQDATGFEMRPMISSQDGIPWAIVKKLAIRIRKVMILVMNALWGDLKLLA